jgi:sodium-dependent dicarboxylate transporter 2/3/5
MSTPGEPGARRMRIGLWLGPAAFAATLLAPLPGAGPEAQRMAAVSVLMACWWVTEALPLAATALLPLVMFPVLGLASASEAAAPYANHVIFLFMGGFMLARAMQRWGLHRRIALRVVAIVGGGPSRVVLGFMCATAFLSMWVSNTATAAMMLPIALAVLEERGRESTGPASNFGVCLMLGIAYAASIGGMGTLIGTPPNVLLAGTLERSYSIEVSFLGWMAFALPVVVAFVPLTWWALTSWLYPVERAPGTSTSGAIAERLRDLGSMGPGERGVATLFALTAAAWTLRPVWTDWIPNGTLVTDSTIAMGCALLLFAWPAGRGERLLDWEQAARIPWDALVLFGGGFSLATGFETSGLSAWLGSRLDLIQGAPLPLYLLAIVLALTLLTEFASNTASAAMALPILGAAAVALGVPPLLLCAPAAMAASCAFMLPAATPPNAIVFGSGAFTLPQMLRAGVVIDLIGTLLISAAALLLLPLVFGH